MRRTFHTAAVCANVEVLPIEAYAAIGNGRTVALVGANGSIDWCCLPRLDSPPILDHLLDPSRGARFALSPLHGGVLERRYVPGTNVLETTVRTRDGVATVTDHMARRGGSIVRVAVGIEGAVTLCAQFRSSPRQDAARGSLASGIVVGANGAHPLVVTAPTSWRSVGDRVWDSTVAIHAGESAVWSLELRSDDARIRTPADPDRSITETIGNDSAWAGRICGGGEFAGAVRRSLLALRLLVQDPGGGIAAAATTSLPEEFGGTRNWDYRYCWLRDAALSLDALMRLGLHDEAMRFWDWLERIGRRGHPLHVLYAVDGTPPPREESCDDLPGYRGSRPVRVGNAAAAQVQHDVPGYVLDAALRCQTSMREPHENLRPLCRRLADSAAAQWREPDQGLWEIRGAPRHYVHSKLMTWVALDRALRLAQRGWLDGDVDGWHRARAAVRQAILQRGFDPERRTFVQAFGERQLDAATLMIPLVGFLPADDPRVLSTLDAVSDELGVGDLLYRYRADDGLPGNEGAFVACSFWRVELLARAGRREPARELMIRLLDRTNDVGLLAEEIDPESGAFLGNFPQAFSHLALVRAALALEAAGV